MTSLSFLTLVAALAMPAAQPAQNLASQNLDSPPATEKSSDKEIVVEGRRERAAIQIKQLLDQSTRDQIGRFEMRVCPGVVGFPENMAATLVGVIRDNLEKADVDLDKENCKPNALLIFTTQPTELVLGLYDKDASLFGNMTPRDIKRVANESSKIYSWHVIEQRGRNGEVLGNVSNVAIGGGATAPASEGGIKIVRNASASRIYENVREDITLAITLIDIDATDGKTLQQLADIATLHLVLDIAPDAAKRAQSDSILTLFNDREDAELTPQKLSEFDFRTLKGLYSIKANNYKGNRQIGRIAGMIENAEEADEAESANRK